MFTEGRADWPATPQLEFVGGNEVPSVRVIAGKPDDVERVDVFYCLNNDWPTTRFWRAVPEVHPEKDAFIAATPFLAETDTLYAFANVTFKTGVSLSSRLVKKSVADLPGVKPTLKREALIDAMDSYTDWNWVPAYTDPCREDRFFGDWKGPAGELGFTLDAKTFNLAGPTSYYFGTRKIGDSQFNGVGRKVLLLDHLAKNAPEKLTGRPFNRPRAKWEASSRRASPAIGESNDAPGGWRRASFAICRAASKLGRCCVLHSSDEPSEQAASI